MSEWKEKAGDFEITGELPFAGKTLVLGFNLVELLRRTVLFSGYRVKPDNVPKGLRLHEIRREDTDDMAPYQIAGASRSISTAAF